jgi:hypothetical protein
MPLIRITEEEFSAWTSGREQAFFQQQGSEAMHHYCQWKSAAVQMSNREVMDGPESRWGATPMLGAMDPSERQGASYHLGLMMATAWARRRYNIPWLLHLDLYREQHDVVMTLHLLEVFMSLELKTGPLNSFLTH